MELGREKKREQGGREVTRLNSTLFIKHFKTTNCYHSCGQGCQIGQYFPLNLATLSDWAGNIAQSGNPYQIGREILPNQWVSGRDLLCGSAGTTRPSSRPSSCGSRSCPTPRRWWRSGCRCKTCGSTWRPCLWEGTSPNSCPRSASVHYIHSHYTFKGTLCNVLSHL